MKKIIRLTESDLMRLVKRVINEQSFKPQDGMMNSEIEVNQLTKTILPQKGYKKFLNLPEAGNASKFCNRPNMDGCFAFGKGSKIVIIGSEGNCYFNNKPDGVKNGPFTYSETVSYL